MANQQAPDQGHLHKNLGDNRAVEDIMGEYEKKGAEMRERMVEKRRQTEEQVEKLVSKTSADVASDVASKTSAAVEQMLQKAAQVSVQPALPSLPNSRIAESWQKARAEIADFVGVEENKELETLRRQVAGLQEQLQKWKRNEEVQHETIVKKIEKNNQLVTELKKQRQENARLRKRIENQDSKLESLQQALSAEKDTASFLRESNPRLRSQSANTASASLEEAKKESSDLKASLATANQKLEDQN